MYEQEQQAGQINFYDHISSLMDVFKQLLALVKLLATKINQEEEFQENINQIKMFIAKQQIKISYQNALISKGLQFQNLLQRCICRIMELIQLHKDKYQGDVDNNFTLELLITIENYVNSHRNERNINLIFKKIFYYTLQYCEASQILLSLGTQLQAIEMFKKLVSEQKIKSQQQPSKIPKQTATQPQQTAFHKYMVILNRRFSTINCLDIDYNNFKSLCFMSKNSQKQLYNDYKERNSIPIKMVNRYSKQYRQYIKRKDKDLVRKKNIKNNKKENTLMNFQRFNLNQNNIKDYDGETKLELQTFFPFIHQQKQRGNLNEKYRKDRLQSKDQKVTSRKHYKMNNILISMIGDNDYLSSKTIYKQLRNNSQHQDNYKKNSISKGNFDQSSIKYRALTLQMNNKQTKFQQKQTIKKQMEDSFRVKKVNYTIHRFHIPLGQTNSRRKNPINTLDQIIEKDFNLNTRIQKRQIQRLNPEFYN